MGSEPPFLLSRVTAEDMERILDLQYDCFPPHLCVIFMGCHSKADLPKLRDKYVQQMRGTLVYSYVMQHPLETLAYVRANLKPEDPSDIWVKVEDSSTGDLIAASNWKIHINGATKGDSPDEVPEGIEGDDLKESQRIIELFNTKRAECNPGPFLRKYCTGKLSINDR